LTFVSKYVLCLFMTRTPDLMDWLARRTTRDEATGCLIWRGALFDGYPYGRLPGAPTRKIPRALYERLHGPPGPGMAVQQVCRNRACCEPAHLASATRGEAVLAGDGPCARNARKTACKRGHPFDAGNTYVDPAGRRRCRACKLDMEGAWLAAVGRKGSTTRLQCEALGAT
jgi:hypothetical protein